MDFNSQFTVSVVFSLNPLIFAFTFLSRGEHFDHTVSPRNVARLRDVMVLTGHYYYYFRISL